MYTLTLKQTQREKGRVTTTSPQEMVPLFTTYTLTLKQTQREKGRVTTTSPQEMAVSNQPQNPIPL
jgi:hypothetical protein